MSPPTVGRWLVTNKTLHLFAISKNVSMVQTAQQEMFVPEHAIRTAARSRYSDPARHFMLQSSDLVRAEVL